MTMATRAATKPAQAEANLNIERKASETEQAAIARAAADPLVRSLFVGQQYFESKFGNRLVTESMNELRSRAEAVNAGDLSSVERTLVAQAAALDSIFASLASRAAANVGQYIDAADKYLRLALKAQAQCRATLETLAAIKQGPPIFARQANIANGPQQVNNGGQPPGSFQRTTHGRAHAGAEILKNGDQPHEPGADAEAGEVDERIRALLGDQQAVGMPMPGAGSQGLERVPVPRGAGRGTKGEG